MAKKKALGDMLDVLISSKETGIAPTEVERASPEKEPNKAGRHIGILAKRHKGILAHVKIPETVKHPEGKKVPEKAKRHIGILANKQTPNIPKTQQRLSARQGNAEAIRQKGILAKRHKGIIHTPASGKTSVSSDKPADIKRFVAFIGYEVYNDVKRASIKSNKSISDYVTGALTDGLKKEINVPKGKEGGKIYGLTLYVPAALFTGIKLKACDLKVPFNRLIGCILKGS